MGCHLKDLPIVMADCNGWWKRVKESMLSADLDYYISSTYAEAYLSDHNKVKFLSKKMFVLSLEFYF